MSDEENRAPNFPSHPFYDMSQYMNHPGMPSPYHFPPGFPFHNTTNSPNQMPNMQFPNIQQPNFKNFMDGANQVMQFVNKTGPMIKQLSPLFDLFKQFK